jgi:hypothetical protein
MAAGALAWTAGCSSFCRKQSVILLFTIFGKEKLIFFFHN